MQTFEVTLKNEKERSYRLIILFLVILHILFFVYLLFDEQLWKKAVAGLIVTILYSGYRLLITNTAKKKFSFGSGYFFLFSILSSINWLFAVIEMILYLLSFFALEPIILSFTSLYINKTKFPNRKFYWQELLNVILKDNILTLDFKNNKLLQAEIENTNIDENEFNAFAKAQLNNQI